MDKLVVYLKDGNEVVHHIPDGCEHFDRYFSVGFEGENGSAEFNKDGISGYVLTTSSKKVVSNYIVWNPSKLAWNCGGLDLDWELYESLLVIEKAQECSWSSFISTDDIDAVISAVHNETDVELKYHELTLTETTT